MPQIHTVEAVLDSREKVTRELRAESKEDALRLMKAKFSDAKSITWVNARDITMDDQVKVLSARVESKLNHLDKQENDFRLKRNRGFATIILGIASTIGLFFAGWIAWATFAIIAIGTYEYGIGTWGIKRAKKLKTWEMESLKS